MMLRVMGENKREMGGKLRVDCTISRVNSYKTNSFIFTKFGPCLIPFPPIFGHIHPLVNAPI